MGARQDPRTGLDVQSSPARLTASMTWDQMAAFHSSGRNNAVVQALVNAVAVKQMRTFAELAFSADLQPDAVAYDDEADDEPTAVGAALQLPGGEAAAWTVPAPWQARLAALQATPAVCARFARKATSSVEAHCIPCAVAIGGTHLDQIVARALLANGSFRFHDGLRAARAPFAEIDPLPLIFNECDSHAERLGLKSALLAACQGIAYGLSAPSPRQVLDRVHNGYECWKGKAIASLGATIARNQEMLAQAQKSGDVFQIVSREAKIGILEAYCSDTATVAPLDLTAGYVGFLYAQVSDIVR